MSGPYTFSLTGIIASAGFASGDRIVVGDWTQGPLGPMNDIMWARPDGRRTLVAPNPKVADFIGAIYTFDEILIEPVRVESVGRVIRISCDQLSMTLVGGRRIPIPLGRLRTPMVTRRIEGPIARRLLNVNTYGVTESGVEEWYRADGIRRVAFANATIAGVDAGKMTRIRPPMKVGVSEPPEQPSIVNVRPLLRDRSGRVFEVTQ